MFGPSKKPPPASGEPENLVVYVESSGYASKRKNFKRRSRKNARQSAHSWKIYASVRPKGWVIMQDEWTRLNPSDKLVKFTYLDLPTGEAFLTAQIAGHEVVCSVILPKPELPFSRKGVERHFEHGADFGVRPRAS